MSNPEPTNADILWSGRNSDGWNQGARCQYGDEFLSIADIAARSGQPKHKVSQYIRDFDWSLEKFFNTFGDTGKPTKL